MNLNFIKVERRETSFGEIWVASLSRPEALNALNSQLLSELSTLFSQVATLAPQKVRALVLTGEGTKAFVAGADIKEMQDLTPLQAQQFSEKGQKIFSQLEALPIPTVAAVNGFALGGGLELALSCDFLLASTNVKVGLPEVSLGLIPGFGGTHRLAQKVGLQKALQMMLSGSMINAEEALNAGLFLKVVPQETLLTEVINFLQPMLEKAPLAMAQAKKLCLESLALPSASALSQESHSFAGLFMTSDQKEGCKAFLEKRKSIFKGQ